MCTNAINNFAPFRFINDKINTTFDKLDPSERLRTFTNRDLTGIDTDLKTYRFRTKLSIGLLATVAAIVFIAALAIAPVALKILVVICGLAAIAGAGGLLAYHMGVRNRIQSTLDEGYYNVIYTRIESSTTDHAARLATRNAYETHLFLKEGCCKLAIDMGYTDTAIYILDRINNYEGPGPHAGEIEIPAYIDLSAMDENVRKGYSSKELKQLPDIAKLAFDCGIKIYPEHLEEELTGGGEEIDSPQTPTLPADNGLQDPIFG